MPTRTITDIDLDVDDEGFLRHAGEWTERMGHVLAREAGIDTLTPEHWRVVDAARHAYLHTGRVPTLRALSTAAGMPVEELRQLFPTAPAEVAAKIAGIPRPRPGGA